MLKFKFEKGRTLKAYESVIIFGKTEEGLAKSVEWICTHLVLSEGQTVMRAVENKMRVTVRKKDEPLWVYGEILAMEHNSETADIVWEVVKLRNTSNYAVILRKPELEFAYLL